MNRPDQITPGPTRTMARTSASLIATRAGRQREAARVWRETLRHLRAHGYMMTGPSRTTFGVIDGEPVVVHEYTVADTLEQHLAVTEGADRVEEL